LTPGLSTDNRIRTIAETEEGFSWQKLARSENELDAKPSLRKLRVRVSSLFLRYCGWAIVIGPIGLALWMTTTE
jgi:hypothetical protein